MKKEGKEQNQYKFHQALVLHDLSDCKKNPKYKETNKQKDKKVSFTAKLSKILAQEKSDDK